MSNRMRQVWAPPAATGHAACPRPDVLHYPFRVQRCQVACCSLRSWQQRPSLLLLMHAVHACGTCTACAVPAGLCYRAQPWHMHVERLARAIIPPQGGNAPHFDVPPRPTHLHVLHSGDGTCCCHPTSLAACQVQHGLGSLWCLHACTCRGAACCCSLNFPVRCALPTQHEKMRLALAVQTGTCWQGVLMDVWQVLSYSACPAPHARLVLQCQQRNCRVQNSTSAPNMPVPCRVANSASAPNMPVPCRAGCCDAYVTPWPGLPCTAAQQPHAASPRNATAESLPGQTATTALMPLQLLYALIITARCSPCCLNLTISNQAPRS